MLNGLARARDRPCSDCWHHQELRAGRIKEQDWVEIENAMSGARTVTA